MDIPAAFTRTVVWFDLEIRKAQLEPVTDLPGFICEYMYLSDRAIVKDFLTSALATLKAPGQLEEMFRLSGARVRFEEEEMLRMTLAEIARRLE